MKLIELHILQSFPVSCLNRDDVGAPKSAVFGGASRARISSQCLKRAARVAARECASNFRGIRTRFIEEQFAQALQAAGLDPAKVDKQAKAICEVFSSLEKNKPGQVTTAVFLSPGEIKEIAQAVAGGEDPKKAAKKANRLDAADIALFGRMVANDATLNIEGAAMFSHALSTHKASNDIDYFSTVDEGKVDAEDSGAGMIGTLEFSSATYYRYAAVNLDLLFDAGHLDPRKLDANVRRETLRAFLHAVLTAVPGARKNSMNAATLPYEVLGILKDKGQPIQLINAFERPVRANGDGFAEESKKQMGKELEQIKKIWGIEHREEIWLSETGLETFLDQLTGHVA